MQPLGGEEINSGYKGYGLAMMVELLTGVMGGGDSAHHIRKWNSFDKPANLGQMFVAVDPDRFCPVSRNFRLIAQAFNHSDNLKLKPPKPGFNR